MNKKRIRTAPSTMDLVPLCKVPRSIRTEMQAIASKQDRPFARVIRAVLSSYIAAQKQVAS